jgi:hypothetical protein
MNPPSAARPERRRLSWVATLTLLAAPKCLLCLGAWLGLGALFAGPELCGAAESFSWTAWLVPLGLGVALGAWHCIARRSRLP